MTQSAFYRLHPNLQHAIVHDVGWRELRPVQEQPIGAILDGANTVILAPTAGGKTEASVFPVLSNILTNGTPPVAALYVCPLRALLNNQEYRMKRYARMVGLDAFKWHGDVGAADRRRFLEQPTHILMTTPESLEVMLINRAGEAAQLVGALSTVIIDEVHAFAGDDRGAHLVSILERLTRFCQRDSQRIGRSAIELQPEGVTWHTFAGGAINAVLVAAREALGGEWAGGNLSVSTTDPAAAAGAVDAVREVIGMEMAKVAAEAARRMPRGKLTKFQPCLPEEMELELIVRRVFDVEGATRFLREQDTAVVQR